MQFSQQDKDLFGSACLNLAAKMGCLLVSLDIEHGTNYGANISVAIGMNDASGVKVRSVFTIVNDPLWEPDIRELANTIIRMMVAQMDAYNRRYEPVED